MGNLVACPRKICQRPLLRIKKGSWRILVYLTPQNRPSCTLRFGDDPATSVLDPLCRSHDIPNLYVMDASFLPSSAAQNPALTVAAQALRVADKAGIA